MQSWMERYSGGHRTEALAELERELRAFCHDGLVQLAADLARAAVVRGTWGGCVISYRRGGPGSTRRDRLGRARNAFTVLWDDGAITDDDVLARARAELVRRGFAAPAAPTPGAEPPVITVSSMAGD